jgi:hypothetical protein
LGLMGRSQGGVRFPLPDLHWGGGSDGYGFKRFDLRERASCHKNLLNNDWQRLKQP